MKELLHTNIKVYVCRRGIRVTYYKLNTLLEHTKGVLKKHILYSSLNDDLTQKREKKHVYSQQSALVPHLTPSLHNFAELDFKNVVMTRSGSIPYSRSAPRSGSH